MRRIIITCVFLSFFVLSGCFLFHPYQPDVQQGNLISPLMVDSLKIGMSKEEVQSALGNPVLTNIFNNDHWAYTYTFQHNGGPIVEKRLDVYFKNDRLIRITQR